MRTSAAFSTSRTMQVHNPFYLAYLKNPLVLVTIILSYFSSLLGPTAYSGLVPWEPSVLCLVKITHSFVQITCETLQSQQRPAIRGRPSFPSRLPLQSKVLWLTILSLLSAYRSTPAHGPPLSIWSAPLGMALQSPCFTPPPGRAGEGEET